MSTRLSFRTVDTITAIDAAAWDICANPPGSTFNPFVTHAFLKALEESRSATARTGWRPHHAVLTDADGTIAAAAPLYLKAHSLGEYVFDQSWAEAWERAGGRYYPKLLCAVPFTPVTGRRLLIHPKADQAALSRRMIEGLIAETVTLGVSSFHVNFPTIDEWGQLAGHGFLPRIDQQFHFVNNGYGSFDDFLATLAHDKRKNLRKERQRAHEHGISFAWRDGADIRESDWDYFFAFYMDTSSRKWGSPYLTRAFFSQIGQTMADNILIVFAIRNGKPVAGALNFVGGDTIYGRYWGAIEHHPFLHFETCYYQAIDYAIARGLKRVEAGAQGMHKLARGYMPVPVHSAHFIPDERFRSAVARYLADERAAVANDIEILGHHGPFRKEP